jgi:site-specific recombinase XerD
MENDQIIKLWVDNQRSLHTREAYAADILKFCTFIQDKPFGAIELGDIQNYAEFLTTTKTIHGKRYAAKTRQRMMIAVKSLFSFATDEGILTGNPARKLKIEKCQDNRSARILEKEDIAKLLAAPKNERDLLILKTLFLSGARVSELTELTWQDVQPNPEIGGQLNLFGKGGKTRIVGIPSSLYEELTAYRERIGGQIKDRVFTSQKDASGMTRQQVFRIVKKAAKEAGVNWGTSPHWLRHCFATEGLRKGAPLHLLQRDLGHASLSTTQIYLDVKPTEATSLFLTDQAGR